MLVTQAVKPALLELLKSIMLAPEFSSFRLAGGTALALIKGHRFSDDIDLFTTEMLDDEALLLLLGKFGNSKLIGKNRRIITCAIDGLKVDFVSYPYPWIDPPVLEENIRLASMKDISAMKLNAITGRGSRKDFVDIFFLLNEFSLTEMLKFFGLKYPEGSPFLVLKSLTYIYDAELQPMPRMITPADWNHIKSAIAVEVNKIVS